MPSHFPRHVQYYISHQSIINAFPKRVCPTSYPETPQPFMHENRSLPGRGLTKTRILHLRLDDLYHNPSLISVALVRLPLNNSPSPVRNDPHHPAPAAGRRSRFDRVSQPSPPDPENTPENARSNAYIPKNPLPDTRPKCALSGDSPSCLSRSSCIIFLSMFLKTTLHALSEIISVKFPLNRSQSFKTVSLPVGFPDAPALSAYSAVKLKDIVISLEFSIVPSNPFADLFKYFYKRWLF